MNIKQIIFDSIHSINQQLKIEELDNTTEETPLFELLDSLGTLDLILELESRLEETYGRYIAVANEESMDAKHTPFNTIVSLEGFLRQRIESE